MYSKKNAFKVAALLLISCTPAMGTAFNSCSVDFVKIARSGSALDTVKGSIFAAKLQIMVKVHSPRIQFMKIDSNSMLIYNPDERTALQMPRNNPVSLPFFQVLMTFLEGNTFPFQITCKAGAAVKKGDSLFIDWIPDGKKASFPGRFKTVYFQDRPAKIEAFEKKGKLLYRMEFSNDTLILGKNIPLQVITKSFQGRDTVYESVKFKNIAVDKPFPDEILNFKLPAEVPIKVIEW